MTKFLNIYHITCFISLLLFGLTLLSKATAQSTQAIEVCYTKSEQSTAQNEDEFLDSFWGDYLTHLFIKHGDHYRFVLRQLPYTRCQIEPTNDESNISIVLQRIYTEQRAQAFLLAPLYASSTVVYYKKSAYPDGLISPLTKQTAKNIRDLLGLTVCGFAGFSYKHYYDNGMPVNWSPKLIRDTASGNRFYNSLELIRANRCDAVDIPTMIFANPSIDATAFEDIGCYHPKKNTPHLVGILIKRSINDSNDLANNLHAISLDMYRSGLTSDMLSAHLSEIVFPADLPDNIKRCLAEGIQAITTQSEPLAPFEDSELSTD